MFFGVAATLLGFSCRADAWGGKKKDVSASAWLARVVAEFVPHLSYFSAAAACMIRT